MKTSLRIRTLVDSDWPAVWRVIEPVFRAGETYVYSPDITEQEAFKIWVDLPTASFVTGDENGNILGTYYIKPNQPALGSHVCNCGYIVAECVRGKGVASQMCRHSQQAAITMGFKAMQFNMVVATNAGAVRLWKKHGFQIVGVLPGAFQHPGQGYVDAFVMYKQLV